MSHLKYTFFLSMLSLGMAFGAPAKRKIASFEDDRAGLQLFCNPNLLYEKKDQKIVHAGLYILNKQVILKVEVNGKIKSYYLGDEATSRSWLIFSQGIDLLEKKKWDFTKMGMQANFTGVNVDDKNETVLFAYDYFVGKRYNEYAYLAVAGEIFILSCMRS